MIIKGTIAKARQYLLDHPKLHFVADYSFALIVTALSAFCFAYGFKAFIAPPTAPHLVSGGSSGIAQIIVKIFQLFSDNVNETLLQSIFYFLVNIPVFVLAWLHVGKRFTVFTLINVLLVSVMIEVIPESMILVFKIEGDNIARALFAGLLTGISASLAYLIGSSSGGIDVIALYMAEKKSTSIGKYSIIINATIVLTYVFISCFQKSTDNTIAVTMALYTCIYFFTSGKVVDVLNTKNRKTELQIFTSSDRMAPVLLHAFPHGCTIVNARGGYTGADRKIIYMVVSYNEVKKAVKVMREVDADCFVTVMNSYQVYGKFYIRPIR